MILLHERLVNRAFGQFAKRSVWPIVFILLQMPKIACHTTWRRVLGDHGYMI